MGDTAAPERRDRTFLADDVTGHDLQQNSAECCVR